MRIQYVSDVHTEWHRDKGRQFCAELPEIGDVLVIAGDFGVYNTLKIRLMELLKRGFEIVYVTGNHEYYASNRGQINRIMFTLMHKFPKFHWLNNSMVEINGQRFLGGTMWWEDSVYASVQQRDWGDMRSIPTLKKWRQSTNHAFIRFIDENLKPGDVVVTHHAPSYMSVSPQYVGDSLNCFYVCSMEKYIIQREPAVWIHGHMHSPVNYELGGTRIVSNPHGYPNDFEARYVPGKHIEL